MTKEALSQFVSLKIEIAMLESRMISILQQQDRMERDTVIGSGTEFPYIKQHITIEGYSIADQNRRLAKIKRLASLIENRKSDCIDMQVSIQEFINSIPDSKTRLVFTYRYIDGLSWLQIAFKIGKYDESYPRQNIHDKYLKNISETELTEMDML